MYICSHALGMFTSSIAPDFASAHAIGHPLAIIWSIYGGLYLNHTSSPIYTRWLSFISAFRWTFIALMSNEFKNRNGFTCKSTDVECFQTGDQWLKRFSLRRYITFFE